MKHIKTYEPSVDGSADTGYWPTMEEYGIEGSWVTFTEYEILQDENIELKRENERLMALVNSHTEDS